jgi:bifunctional ADP-heptose synthase (sugar kinase/adenylyltransferase)
MITLPDFSGLRVHVIGDAIRDVYTQAKCLGAASKSPTLVYEKGESQEWEGGAGVIAEHCKAAGVGQVILTTAGETVKERIIVEGVKVAEFHIRPALPWIEYLTDARYTPDVVILADFGHGMREQMKKLIPHFDMSPMVTAADSQVSGTAWGNILDFAGCDLLFANEREARFALRYSDRAEPEVIAPDLFERAAESGTHAVFLKRGAEGLWIVHGSGNGALIEIPPYASQPIVDPIGAGDALLAYATLTYAVTKDLEQAGIIGSLAAAEACAHMGNVPVTLEAVKARAGALA